MAKQLKRFGKTVTAPPKAAIKAQMGAIELKEAAKEVLKVALEDEYEKVFPGSIRVEGDVVHARVDTGGDAPEDIRVSLSRKEVIHSRR